MKFIGFSILFYTTMLLLMSNLFIGCGNEYVPDLVEPVFFTPPIWLNTAPAAGTIGPVPEDLANLLWGDLDAHIEDLEDVLDDGIIETDQGPVHDLSNIMPEYLRGRIAEIREHRAFYGKYINAGGVAIIGNAFLEDICFYAARDAVLGMTSKMPELREYLSPIQGDRENLTGKIRVPDSEFRMVIHDWTHSEDIPEWKLGQKGSPIGACGLEFCHATTDIYEDHTGNDVLSMSVFIHEFAHALNYAFNLVDVTFEERLKVAYQDAKENDDSYWGRYDGGANVAESGYREYWAWCSTEWFTQFSLPTKSGEQDHTRFREKDPLMYEFLDDIYDFQYLGDIEVRVYR